MPELGENIESGDVVRVAVQPGQEVTSGQTVLELETDKAVVEVPSTVSGTVREVKAQVGQKLKVGDLVLTVDAKAESEAPAPAAQENAATAGAESAAQAGEAEPVDNPSDDGYMAITRHSFRTARTAEGKSEQQAFPPDARAGDAVGSFIRWAWASARATSTARFRRRRLYANWRAKSEWTFTR